MAKIPLRQYTREIENLIDRGQIDEALAHSKYILKAYPKCIDVYRLLGKAYLETQRYGEAADILQRVLSSIPDDFVSHVGMSIIREDEGDLNSAVWHMERAYETQPSNGAVQEELRRLYGRRDGVEPPKIRMTRGALVRMYARGHLYEQAIAEVRAALDEDPARTDLQVILAHLYAQTNSKIEATALCSELITKSPYCFEANRILSEVLSGASRSEDIATYRQRVIDLDPYMEFVTPDKNLDEVPETAVMIERLQWDPNKSETSQPSWAATLGVNIEPDLSAEHVLPDWLASLSAVQQGSPRNETAQKQPESTGAPIRPGSVFDTRKSIPEEALGSLAGNITPGSKPETPAGDNQDLPGWMKDAGWTSPTGEFREEPFVFTGKDESEEAVMNTELPEWLQSLAPPGASEDQGDVEKAAEQFAWLENISKTKSETGEIPVENLNASSTDEWSPNAPEPVKAPAEETPQAEAVPSWLESISETATEASEEAENVPEIPGWSTDETPVQPVEEKEDVVSIPDQGKEDTLAWLDSLAQEHNAAAPTLILRRSDRLSGPPGWVNEVVPLADEPEQPIEPATPEEGVPSPESVPPALTQEENQGVESFSGAVEETLEIPEGVPAAVEEPPEGPKAPPATAEEEFPEAFPDWLVALASEPVIAPEQPATPEAEPEQEAAPIQPEPFRQPEPDLETIGEQESALVWLDQLSAMHPAQEAQGEEFPSQPAPADIASAWIKESSFAIPQEETLAAVPEDQPAEEEISEEAPAAELIPAEAESAEIALPDWLNMIEQPAEEGIIPLVEEEAPAVTAAEPEEAAWVKEDLPESEVQSEVTAETEVPQLAESELAEPAVEEVVPVDSEHVEAVAEEELPAWLSDLSAKINEPVPPLEPQAETEETPQAMPEDVPVVTPVMDVEAIQPVETVEAEEPQPVALEEPQILEEPVAESTTVEEPELVQAGQEAAQIPELEEAAVLPLAEEIQPIEAAVSAVQEEEITAEPSQQVTPVLEVPETISVLAEPAIPIQPVLEEPAPSIVPAEPAVLEPATLEEPVPDIVPAETAVPVETVLEEPEAVTMPSEPALPPEPEIEEPVVASVPAEPEPVAAFVSAPTAPLHASLPMAQRALQGGDLDGAVGFYSEIVQRGDHIEEIIHDLREAIYRYPVDVSIWQLLGDAYLRANCLQEAIDAYTKAEELIR